MTIKQLSEEFDDKFKKQVYELDWDMVMNSDIKEKIKNHIFEKIMKDVIEYIVEWNSEFGRNKNYAMWRAIWYEKMKSKIRSIYVDY